MSTSDTSVASRWLGMLDGLVHPSSAIDPVELDFERWSIAFRFGPALVALSLFPLYLLVASGSTFTYGGFLALVVAPVVGVVLSALTGRSDIAAISTAGVIASLVLLVAGQSGGAVSPFMVFLVALPFATVKERPIAGPIVLAAVAIIGVALVAILHGADPAAATAFVADNPILTVLIALAALAPPIAASSLLTWRGRAMAQAQADRLRRQEFLTEAVTDVVSRHGRDGLAVYVSPASAGLLDAPSETLLGKGWIEAVHPADRRAFHDAIEEAAVTGALVAAEFRMKRARIVPIELRDYACDTDYVWVEMRCRANPLADETDGELIAITRDISAHKIQERALENAREDAESANRAKTRFLASMSHELRTPLNAIIGFSEILDNEVFGPIGPPRNKEYVKLIHDSGTHLLQLVNDILDTSKIESGRFQVFPEPFDLASVVKASRALLQTDADKKKIAVTTQIAADMPELHADKRAVKQILLNLLSNAVKFTPENGRISIQASYDDDLILLSVADTGIGISQEDLGRVGQPFVQADTTYSRVHEGTGLGLSVVRGLTELHHAEMAIESEVGLGTTVSIRFRRDLPDAIMGDYREHMRDPTRVGRMIA